VKVLATIAEVRAEADAARADGGSVGLVPTMGYYHAGHRSLMDAAVAGHDLVIVSSFVNPTQFAPTEDLAAYPRDGDADDALAGAAGVDITFRPAVEEMYPDGPPRTTVHVAGLTEGMCGATRPTHFDGVTTVVTKLFSIVGPCHAYFGRKDFQQLAVVRRMTRDLDLPVTVVGCPLVREADGLAMSSRNAYLSAGERTAAPGLHAALLDAVDAVRAGTRDADAVTRRVRRAIGAVPDFELEYVEIRDASSLEAVTTLTGEVVIALAARVGRARLIDNVVLNVRGADVDADVGVRIADGPPAQATP
jgi:pantoate--beta-alanine ligase